MPAVAPETTIEIGGRSLDKDKVVEIVVDSHLLLPSSCLVTVPDQQAAGLAGVGAGIGKSLKVKMASGGATPSVPTLLFDGVITGFEVHDDEHRRVLKLQAYDKSYKLHVGRKTESLSNVSDANIIQQTASAAGITASVDPSLNTPIHEVVHRINLTDWEFVTARARERGLVARMKVSLVGATFSVEKAGAAAGPAVTASFGTDKDVVLTAFYPRVTGAVSVASVKVVSWDQKQARQVVGTAKSPSGKSSAQLAKDVESVVNSADRGGQEVVVTNLAVASQTEATAAAEGALEMLAGAHAEADGSAVGDPKLLAGVLLDVQGVGTDVAGKWTLTQVRHVLDEDGYRCHFSATGLSDRGLLGLVRGDIAGPMSAGHQPIVGVVPGIVTDAEDTLNLGRVKVKLAIDDKFVTDWARVATLGAGNDRGLFLPLAVGDEVLVAFDRGDARAPYVVGSLHNQSFKQPQIAGDYVKGGDPTSWAIKSVSGNFLQFRDAQSENFVRIDVKNGQFHVLVDGQNQKVVVKSDGTVEIESKKDITIKSTMGKISIEAQQDVSIKSQAGGVSIEGIKAAVKGTGSVDVNAPMVKVGGGQVMLG